MRASVLHIVVAAGSGSRFGAEVPKQFCYMGGLPVLMHTVNALRHTGSGEVVIVLSTDMVDYWNTLCEKHGFRSPDIVIGGATRWQSVRNAIVSKGICADIISVHDGARPLLSPNLITRLISEVKSGSHAVIPVMPVTDSIRRVDVNGENVAVDRKSYFAVQTPQVFDGNVLREAYSKTESPLFTDDASVVESIGVKVTLTEGEPTNIKITHPLDLAIAEAILNDIKK
ncbi:MAG: 2-C-methyl-D-erythritol 4-phosphate cytidylyltransferase [Paramuribaculum sp.]|nr:2-C-methyl-D-erythritol 4-phosphate cytidylyltransferase [Paramuribaculum sp.]